jgi:hypothetical protein
MHQVFYPGHARQPCIGEYAIAIDRSDTFDRADIVLVSRHGHKASFFNGNIGRDAVLNRILINDLNGVRLDWIRLFVLTEKTAANPGERPDFYGVEIKDIVLDIDDYIAKGNPCTVRRRNYFSRLFTGVSQDVSYWSGHVIGGCARFSTSLENARQLDKTEIESLSLRIGLFQAEPKPAPSNTSTRPEPRNTWSSSSYH